MSEPRRVYLSQIPLLFPLVAIGVGIAAGVELPATLFWILSAIAAVIAVVCFYFRNIPLGIYSMIAIAGALLGKASVPILIVDAQEVTLQGEIRDVKDFGGSYRLVAKSASTGYNYLLWISDTEKELLRGDKIEVSGVAVPPRYFGSVPDEVTNRDFLISHDIYAELTETHGFKVLEEATGLREWPARSRRWLSGKLEYAGLTQQSEQFLKAVLLGDMNVDEDLRADFSESGLSHVLALSGTHVGVIAMIIAMLFFPFTLFGQGRTGIIATLILLWVYAVITGCSPSVVRAVIMISFVLLGKLMERNSNSLNSLCAAGLLILIISPLTLFNVGFQLSFLAVGGILLFMPIFLRPFYRIKSGCRKWLLPGVSLFLLPIAATLATAPLAVYIFHIFPVWFLLSNLLASMLLPIILGGGVCLLLFNIAGIKWGWLAWMLNRLIDAIVGIGSNVASIQPQEMDSLYPTALETTWVYLILILLWLSYNTRRRFYLCSCCAAAVGFVCILTLCRPQYPVTETFEWTARNSFNLLHRQDNEIYIITDSPEKYHQSLQHMAEFRLKDYMGKRRARLAGVYSEGLHVQGVEVESDRWIVGSRRYLILRDGNLLSDGVLLDDALKFDPQVVVLTRGFRGDAGEIERRFPRAQIILSPSMYAPRRKDAANQLADKSGNPKRK